jgi:hypothetical protein
MKRDRKPAKVRGDIKEKGLRDFENWVVKWFCGSIVCGLRGKLTRHNKLLLVIAVR